MLIGALNTAESALSHFGLQTQHQPVDTAAQPAAPALTVTEHPARFHKPLLAVSAACAVTLAGLTSLVVTHPFLPLDASIERSVQAVNFGPLASVFIFFTQIGGPYGVPAMAVVFAILLVFNRHSWRFLVAGAVASGWYFLLNSLVIRARPTVPDVLRVTEHPGASSYPSGHTVLFVWYAVTLMLCLGLKFIPRPWRFLGWIAAVLFVAIGMISRMYSGAHWPSDVLAGLLIGIGWLSLVAGVRWISDPVLAPESGVKHARRSLRALESEAIHAVEGDIEPGLRVRMPGRLYSVWLLTFEQFGLVIRGILYALVGVAAIGATFGVARSVDLQGTLTLLEANPASLPVSIVAAIGLIGYAFWGFVRAFADPLERGGDLYGIIARLGFLWSATAYSGLALFAIQFALGSSAGGGGGLPFGLHHLINPQLTPLALGLFGVVVVFTGLGQFTEAWLAPFRTDFLPQVQNPRMWTIWTWAGRFGLFARGVAFSVIGVLMVRGVFFGETQWDYGLNRAFAVLLGLPLGGTLLVIVALGFISLGLHSVTSPPVLRMKPGLAPPVRPKTTEEA